MTEIVIPRDRWKRPLLPHPETGVIQPWPRISGVAKTLSDLFGLEQWGNRNIVLGMGLRDDLQALAGGGTAEDKGQLGSIVKQAQTAAKASSGANLGTAFHKLTERVDKQEAPPIPNN